MFLFHLFMGLITLSGALGPCLSPLVLVKLHPGSLAMFEESSFDI